MLRPILEARLLNSDCIDPDDWRPCCCCILLLLAEVEDPSTVMNMEEDPSGAADAAWRDEKGCDLRKLSATE